MEFQQDLLTDIDPSLVFTDASAGARFLNFLIDLIVFIVLIVVVLIFMFPNYEENSLGLRVFFYSLYLAYYTLFEIALRGRTVGKLVTGTKAIREDGGEITGVNALLRSLCRFVPFEAFSTFGGRPWHDKWTNTRVVKVR